MNNQKIYIYCILGRMPTERMHQEGRLSYVLVTASFCESLIKDVKSITFKFHYLHEVFCCWFLLFQLEKLGDTINFESVTFML